MSSPLMTVLPISEMLQSKPIQVAFAICIVLFVGTVMFALGWSIATGQPLSPVASNLLSFILGVASSLSGGHLGASIYSRATQAQAQNSIAIQAQVPALANEVIATGATGGAAPVGVTGAQE